MGLLEPGFSVGTIIIGPLQALVTRWSSLGGGLAALTRRGSFAEFQSPSENMANFQKDCP